MDNQKVKSVKITQATDDIILITVELDGQQLLIEMPADQFVSDISGLLLDVQNSIINSFYE
ncbi:MAG: hypothetical protein HC798_04750 [Polaribacter sp.]|nr:hypothetical protein [Polaribacter sp.]